MIIPSISPDYIHDTDLDYLMQVGFCYVKIPNGKLIQTIKTCVQLAKKFFQSNPDEKAKWKLKEVLLPGDRYQGYALRSQSRNTNAIEQIFFEPDSPFGPYESYASMIQEIHDTYRHFIFLPLMKTIFNKLKISETQFHEATKNPNCSLVFQSCPSIGEKKDAIRLNAHKDFGLLTVLFFEEPGLEVYYQNNWYPIPPQEGYVVVNLGNALEVMLGKRCHSALHRVTNATDNRISMVYFYNPNYQQQVRNYFDDTLIALTGELFFKQQFTEYYQLDH